MISINGHLIFDLFLILGGGLLLMSLSHLYHAIRFGSRDVIGITATGIFIAGVATIIWASMTLLGGVDWNHALQISLPTFHIGIPNV